MHKKLTISVDEEVYNGLHRIVGRHKISQFIEGLVRPHVMAGELMAAYQDMASNSKREAEALEWAKATLVDVPHAKR